jgi:hypothetical protein
MADATAVGSGAGVGEGAGASFFVQEMQKIRRITGNPRLNQAPR